ncbi:MAG: hypothetical protein BGN86_11675 [Caulobacterales bacterium 68-7]|nr:MAG: hypothetical protein BGN86_11675 [Caulobacterales bacterium 68-7]
MPKQTVAPEARSAVLVETRRLKMARSPLAFVRGSTTRFYDWLESAAGSALPDGPPVWICGDCHLGNLGPLADRQGRVAIQIRDLDQTVIGNPAHDLVRLALSLASAARGMELPGVATAMMLEGLAGGYAEGLGAGEAEAPPLEPPQLLHRLLKRSIHRRWSGLARERLNGERPHIPLGRSFWPLTPDERAAIDALTKDASIAASVRGIRGRDGGLKVIDAAYWQKGCSSLGRLRYAAILQAGDGDGARLGLIDLKEATTPAAPRARGAGMPRDNAKRVLTGAAALSPHLGQRMVAARLLGKAMVLRELMPQDLKIELERLTASEAVALARYLGAVVGHAHGRQMDSADRAEWRRDLLRGGASTTEVPTWLWSTTVELLGLHESAYLDHCRRFALTATRR